MGTGLKKLIWGALGFTGIWIYGEHYAIPFVSPDSGKMNVIENFACINENTYDEDLYFISCGGIY